MARHLAAARALLLCPALWACSEQADQSSTPVPTPQEQTPQKRQEHPPQAADVAGDFDCDALRDRLAQEREALRSCDQDEDCTVTTGKNRCATSCWFTHNKNADHTKLNQLVDTYTAKCPSCRMSCMSEPKRVVCFRGECMGDNTVCRRIISDLRDERRKQATCNADSECTSTPSQTPCALSCSFQTNKNADLSELDALTEAYSVHCAKRTCKRSCPETIAPPVCHDGHCTTKRNAESASRYKVLTRKATD